MKIGKIVMVLVLFAVLSATVFAATVTHPAENIRAGIFGNIYAGNWSFMNGSVGIGTTNTSQKLMVKASAQHDGVYLQNTIGDIVGKMVAGSTDDGYIRLYNSSGTDQLTLTSRGNSYFLGGSVGIGATSPTATLQVNSSNSDGAFAVYNGSGSPLLFVNGSNGRVGIGTTGPGQKLDVVGTTHTYIRVASDATNEDAGFYSSDGTTNVISGLIGSACGAGNWVAYSGGCRIVVKTDGNVGIGTTSPAYLLQVADTTGSGLSLNVSDVLYVNGTSGNVGIGTTGPSATVQIHKAGTQVRPLRISTSDGLGTAGYYVGLDFGGSAGGLSVVSAIDAYVFASSNIGLRFQTFNGALNDAMVIDGSGNVGIGTTSPTAKLHINGTGELLNISNATNTFLYVSNSGNPGRVGIGKSNPIYTLDVKGDARFVASVAGEFEINAQDDNGATSWPHWTLRHGSTAIGSLRGVAGSDSDLIIDSMESLFFQDTDGTKRAIINMSTGKVGIGTMNPEVALHVDSATTGLCVTSDDDCLNDPPGGRIAAEGAFLTNADYAEKYVVDDVEPGDIVVIDTESGEYDRLRKSTAAYDPTIVGIVSTDPGIVIGSLSKEYGTPIALAGRAPVKATTENGPINKGDLLTTSSIPGHAMKCDDRLKCIGAIVGKALEPLDSGTGKVMALVTLQ